MSRFIIVFSCAVLLINCKKDKISASQTPIADSNQAIEDSITLQFRASLKKELIEKIKNTSCPGAAIQIIRGGKDFLTLTLGLKSSAAKNDFIDSKTVFRIGSLSKGFAGILVAKLVNEGKINLNGLVQKYIPEFKLKAKQKKDSIRVWHILSHCTGLTEHAFTNLLDQEQDKATIIKALNKVTVRDSTGKVYAYQNASFSLIEEIVQSATGLTFGEALQTYIFNPLLMSKSNTSYDSLMHSSNKALPHQANGRPIPISKVYYNAPSAGGINSNLEDMTKWLKALMGLNENVISQNDRALAFQKRVWTSWDDKYYNSWEKADSSYYGLGWRIIKLNEQTIVFHGGQVNNYRCEIAFNPITKNGVVALFNAPCDLSNTIVPLIFSILDDPSFCLMQAKNVSE